jgi:antitoxin component YwqK of YwqJK toxin-antitoxin module
MRGRTWFLAWLALLAACTAVAEEPSPVIVLAGSKGNRVTVKLSVPGECAGEMVTEQPKVKGPPWVVNVRVEPSEILSLSPGGSRDITIHFDVQQGTKQDTAGTLEAAFRFYGETPDPVEARTTLEVPLLVDEPPELTVSFDHATHDAPPRLNVKLESESSLDIDSLRIKVDERTVNPKVTAGQQNRLIAAVHVFDETQPVGKHEVEVNVTGSHGVAYLLKDIFTYIAAFEVTGYSVADPGGRPENEKANSEETVQITLKVRSFEPSAVNNVGIVWPEGDNRLVPTGGRAWSVPSLYPLVDMKSAPLGMKVAKISQRETVKAECATAVGQKLQVYATDVAIEIFPALDLAPAIQAILDPEKAGTVNNGDGVLNFGEEATLVLDVRNAAETRSPAWSLYLTSNEERHLDLGKRHFPGNAPLAADAVKTLKVPLAAGTDMEQERTVVVEAVFRPEADEEGVVEREILVVIKPPPLKLELVPPLRLDDPETGALAKRNNNDKVLNNGEKAFIYATVKNTGPPLSEIYFSVEPLKPLKSGGVNLAKAGAVAFTDAAPTHKLMLEIEVPVDFRDENLPLKLSAHGRGAAWSTTLNVPVVYRSAFAATLALTGPDGKPVQPAALVPGKRYTYRLRLTCTQEGGAQHVSVNLRVPQGRVSLSPPTTFSNQSFPKGVAREYQGSFKVPEVPTWEGFAILVDVRDELRADRELHGQSFALSLGAQETKVIVAATRMPVGHGMQKWKLAVTVKDADDKPVERGRIELTTTAPTLSAAKVDLDDGEAEIIWTAGEDFGDQALVEVAYADTLPEGTKGAYLPGKTEIFIPPEVGEPTRVDVRVEPDGKPEDNRFILYVKVLQTDAGQSPVTEGSLWLETDLGSFVGGGQSVKQGTVAVTGGELALAWQGPANLDLDGTAAIAFLGDVADVTKADTKYAESVLEVPVPPEIALPTEITAEVEYDGDPTSGRYRFLISVCDLSGKPVTSGVVRVAADLGNFSGKGLKANGLVELSDGQVELIWQGPKGSKLTGKASIDYLGDSADDDLEDAAYAETDATMKLPPHVPIGTEVVIKTEPNAPDIITSCEIAIKVHDKKGQPVKEGFLAARSTRGNLSLPGQFDLERIPFEGKKLVFRWSGMASEKTPATFAFTYLGDQLDPHATDTNYLPSEASCTLPDTENVDNIYHPETGKIAGKYHFITYATADNPQSARAFYRAMKKKIPGLDERYWLIVDENGRGHPTFIVAYISTIIDEIVIFDDPKDPFDHDFLEKAKKPASKTDETQEPEVGGAGLKRWSLRIMHGRTIMYREGTTQVQTEFHCKKGILHGPMRQHREDGAIDEKDYADGKVHGRVIKYAKGTREVERDARYEKGRFVRGRIKYFEDDGTLRQEYGFDGKKLTGRYVDRAGPGLARWNGTIRDGLYTGTCGGELVKGQYTKGKEDGTWTYYDKKGVYKQVIYKMGKIVKTVKLRDEYMPGTEIFQQLLQDQLRIQEAQRAAEEE